MAKPTRKRTKAYAWVYDIQDKRIVSVQPNMKSGASADRYAEMEAFVQRQQGRPTIGDVLAKTSYHAGDFSFDIQRDHIKLADATEFSPDAAGEMRGSALDALLVEEGKLSERVIQVRSRSDTVRELCITRHGSRCFVCKLDFGKRFGEEFTGLIEVHHHKEPLAQRDGGKNTNPESDCVPLCPNCHRMALFGLPLGECRSLDELQELFVRSKHKVAS